MTEQTRSLILRLALLLLALLAALLLLNLATSLRDVWQLSPGSVVPSPWNNLFDANRATQRSDSLALLGMALFAGAGLACLVFVLERVIRSGAGWISDAVRK